MFLVLLAVTLAIAALTSAATALLFSRPVNKLLGRLVTADLAPVWHRYIQYAIYVVGISGGVRIWDIERYVTPDKEGNLLTLTTDRWIVEVYKTLIGALQSVAWMLLIVFLFALIAYVVVRGFESRRTPTDHTA
ncbi:MAG TPA: hypothetical protein VFV75_13250 [Candidatus Polarisedimenticolaceae bacterium]|nr:hypothetical protein [Candidatus Polarisedimenticolaceae bacterium]